MIGLTWRIPGNGSMWWALPAGLVGLGLMVLSSGAAMGQGSSIGPYAVLDSATDDGGGRIRISWSISAARPGYTFINSHPDEVCVHWRTVKDGVRGSDTDTCFTDETANQTDLLVDTGIGADGPATVFEVLVRAYYDDVPRFHPEEPYDYDEVTLNAPD